MKFVALISGGKDSFFNIFHCIANGHELVALANLHPKELDVDELNSFMFQTVGHDVINYYSECLDKIPLYRKALEGSSVNVQLEYLPTIQDEIEDLHLLLQEVLRDHSDIEAVSCGAILSNYQRTRVEDVCERLGLTSLAYLWQRNQENLIREMCDLGLDARLIKVASVGLEEKHLGLLLQEALPTLMKLKALYDVHVCGEGGEFESLVLDAPIFSKRLQFVSKKIKSDSSEALYLQVGVEIVHKKEVGNLAHLQIPPLLEEGFKDGIFEDNSPSKESDEELHTEVSTESFPLRISHTSTKLFISNVSSTLDTVQGQTIDILNQIMEILIQNCLEPFDIQHVTLLVKDMSNFASINGVYAQFFAKKYLPPSRVCVGTILPQTSMLQMSCIVLEKGCERLGIHIRSRSYWAPQNIGPYSQAIIQTCPSFKAASLSGQIPLLPASMEISEGVSDSFTSALALQHLHRVMILLNTQKISSCVCYITDAGWKDSVSQVWRSYVERFGTCPNTLKKLLIVQVMALPRKTPVEWSGFAFEPIETYDDIDKEENEHNVEIGISLPEEVTTASSVFGTTTLLVYSGNNLKDLHLILGQKNVREFQITVMASINVIVMSIEKGFSAEWIPVLGTWNFSGSKKSFGVIWER